MRFFLIVLLFLTGCGNLPSLDSSKKEFTEAREKLMNVEISVLDVGQGDSILITSAGESMLVDSGSFWEGFDVVSPYLSSKFLDLSYVLTTHYHEDHVGGLLGIVSGSDLEFGTDDDLWPTFGFFDRGDSNVENSNVYSDYYELTKGKRSTVYSGDSFVVGDSTITVVATNANLRGEEFATLEKVDENSFSIVLLVELGAFRCLLTGDVTGGGGNPPYETMDLESNIADLVGDIDCLKVAHHGSKTSTNQYFLDITKPEVALISVGDENDHGHPHQDVITRLLESGARVVSTEAGHVKNDAVEIANGHIIVRGVNDGSFSVVY